MRGDSYQLSGASGTSLLSNATSPALFWTTTSPDRLWTSTLSSQETQQLQPSSGRRRSHLFRHRIWGTVPLRLDPSSERPSMCAYMAHCAALRWAPGFRPCPPSGVGPLRDGGRRRWRRIPFCHRLGPSPGDLGWRKWRPPPGGTRRGAVNDGRTGDRRRYRIKKLGLNAPTR